MSPRLPVAKTPPLPTDEIVCPTCGGATKVIDMRRSRQGRIWRRRECTDTSCGARFSTREVRLGEPHHDMSS
jgi:hypothetical protein